MRLSVFLPAGALASLAAGLPTPPSVAWSAGKGGWPLLKGWKGPQSNGGMSDIDILHYALTLENVENAFYREGLQNYSEWEFINAGFPDPFYSELQQIAAEEAAHVEILSGTLTSLGAPVSAECVYNFPSTDATGFVALANIIEGLGVSAYIGAARNISSPDVLEVASSIATTEARHSTFLRKIQATSPFASPFDVPLFPDEVHTIAHVFLASCPATNPTFPIKAFPALAVTGSGSAGVITTGSTITLTTPGGNVAATGTYGAFITVKGPIWLDLTPVTGGFTAVVPADVLGQSYVLLNNGNTAVNDESVLAGPTFLEISA